MPGWCIRTMTSGIAHVCCMLHGGDRHGVRLSAKQADAGDNHLHRKQSRHQAGETTGMQLVPQHGTNDTAEIVKVQ